MNKTEEIVDALVATGKWSRESASFGVRAHFKCEYCDRDLLASVDDYKAWQVDHIVPVSSGAADIEKEDNLAVTCSTCNFIVKGKWDPRSACGKNASREELIHAVRAHVAKRKTQFMEDVMRFRRIVYPKDNITGGGNKNE